MIQVIALEPGAGHACGLCVGLSKYDEVNATWMHKSAYGLEMDAIFPGSPLCKKGDILIVFGTATWDKFDTRILKNYKQIKVIQTDGGFMRHSKYWNNRFRGYDLFCTPCKIQFADRPCREYYQPFDLSHVNQTKNIYLTIGHSPYGSVNMTWKGTEQILQDAKDYNIDLITGVSWGEALKRKARCHIFVDQIDHFDGHKYGWRGGVGKSGLEAMLLGCMVISRGKHKGVNIPPPPIAWCEKETFKETLDFFCYDTNALIEQQKKQYEWAKKYLSYDYQARNILHKL